ncbi:hypothetical protein J2S09_004481 [Bacillus fengqiuensis]|nr:hypothetical protein [Bacillus fengqiuensis]
MMEKATFISGKQKYLFCTDQGGLAILNPIIELMADKELSFELVLMGEHSEQGPSSKDLSEWLSQQKMGSYLYAAASWDKVINIRRLAEKIGFSDEEAQYIGYDTQPINVFCCRCHGINKMKEQTEITCCHCGLLLIVSDHYSSLRDTYLGYVAKL